VKNHKPPLNAIDAWEGKEVKRISLIKIPPEKSGGEEIKRTKVVLAENSYPLF
jgi:hypothetical protein